ncbi:unnamed protein product [Pylaiella littoralis]
MILMDRLFAHHDKQAQSSRHTSSGRPHSSSSGRPNISTSGRGSGGHPNNNGKRPARHGKGRGGPPRERPKCTYSKCNKPLGHTIATCYQKARDEKKGRGNEDDNDHEDKRARRHHRRSSDTDDEDN